jgi:arylsulfatase A-like enzyme
MAKLDELKLAERTIVIFTSDNGGVGGYNAAGIRANDHTNNAPLRGGKGMLYEGGIRVPFIVRWSGVIQPGSVCDEALISVDALPTFAELAGAQLDPKIPFDGISLAQLWRTSGRERPQRDAMFWHFPGYLEANVLQGAWRTTPVSVIRSGDFKLLEFLEDNRIELYNVRDDIGEKRNLADALPGKAKELREKLHAWRKSVNAPMPTPNPEYAPPGGE